MQVFRLRNDQAGSINFITAVMLVIGPLIIGALAFAAFSAVRLGGDLTTMFTRDATMNQMAQRLQTNLSNVTALQIRDEHYFVAHDQPSKRSAYYTPVGNMADVCVSNVWELADNGDTRTLINVRNHHEDDSCASPIVSSSTREIAGIDLGTHFEYSNVYGRELVFVNGEELGQAHAHETRPPGLFENEWGHPEAGIVTFRGAMRQIIGETPVNFTAKTPLRQLRPGVVTSVIGELGPPAIARSDRGPDTYRATFTAVITLADPRATVQWQWREAKNVGATPSDFPTENQWGPWSTWSELNYAADSIVPQGTKWQVQARYQIVLNNDSAQSNTTTMTWVRPITATPGVNVNVTEGDGGGALVTTTVSPCVAGISAEVQTRYRINDGAWSGWASDHIAPYERLIALAQGQKLDVQSRARCVTDYAEGPWADKDGPWSEDNTPDGTHTSPITSRPDVAALEPTINASTGASTVRGTIGVCPAGTTIQYRGFWQRDTETARTYGGWVTGNAGTNTASAGTTNEGSRLQGGVQARCVTDYATGGSNEGTSGWVVREITALPTVTKAEGSFSGATFNSTATIGMGECHAGLQLQMRTAGVINETTGGWNPGTYTNITPGTYTRATSTGVAQGERASGRFYARCVSAYTEGPDAAGATTGWSVRPITTMPTATATAPRTNAAASVRIANLTGCPAGTTGQWRSQHKLSSTSTWGGWSGWRNGNGTYSAATLSNGTSLNANFQVRCISDYANGSTRAYSANSTQYVTTPAAPTIPASYSGGIGQYNYGFCSAGSQSYLNWAAVPTATSYSAATRRQSRANGAWDSSWYTAPSNGTRSARSGQTILGSQHSNFQWRLNATNSAGTSAWTSRTFTTGTVANNYGC